MAKKFTELRAGMSQAARERADGMARQMLAEMPLNELRQARGLSQKMLAEVLHVQQPSIAKIEKRTDMYLSTLRSHIEAMGGELDVIAQGGQVHVGSFFDLGNRWLLHMQHFGQHLLRQATGLAQFVERHFSQHLPGHAIGLLACGLSHTRAQFCKFLSHLLLLHVEVVPGARRTAGRQSAHLRHTSGRRPSCRRQSKESPCGVDRMRTACEMAARHAGCEVRACAHAWSHECRCCAGAPMLAPALRATAQRPPLTPARLPSDQPTSHQIRRCIQRPKSCANIAFVEYSVKCMFGSINRLA